MLDNHEVEEFLLPSTSFKDSSNYELKSSDENFLSFDKKTYFSKNGKNKREISSGWRSTNKKLTPKRWNKTRKGFLALMFKRVILSIFHRPKENRFPGPSDFKRMDLQESGKLFGLHWVTAAFFIVAAMAGGGVVAIPLAMLQSELGIWLNLGSLYGIILMVLICGAFFYTSHLLGQNWMLMCEKWPQEYNQTHCRKPYPEMAFRALGKKAKLFTSLIVNEGLFGTAIVYLLLSAKIINEFLTSTFAINFGSCIMVLILAAALLPVTFLKSPQDFWWAIVTAMITTAFSVILILIGTAMDYGTCSIVAEYPEFSGKHLIMSLGIYIFAFGGHSVFPTIQHDMKRPSHFTRSSILGFLMVFLLYLPITILGYITYGNSLFESIINSIQSPWIQQAANLFIAIHCILTLTIVINPINQDLEHVLKIPHHFGWQRILTRSSLMLFIVFWAETIPSFGVILNLVGGTTIALTSAIMPCLFFLYLNAKNEENSEQKNEIPSFRTIVERTPPLTLALNLFIILFTIFCGSITTYAAMKEILTSPLSVPCYLATELNTQTNEHPMHCCGPSLNISRFGTTEGYCPATKFA